MLLQDAMEHFIEQQWRVSNEAGNAAEKCMQSLAHYLVNYSDLYHEHQEIEDDEEASESPEEWEKQLEDNLRSMVEGDDESDWSLGGLDSADFEASHMREFIGWYLPRVDSDVQQLTMYCHVLKAWLNDMLQEKYLVQTQHQDFLAVIMEMQPDAIRAMKVAQLLLHFVRWGSNLSEDVKQQPFKSFVEGHARLARIEAGQLWWRFDDQKEIIGPVAVEQVIVDLLHIGDVLNVQLGQRDAQWQMVDIGPLYPNSIYVEAERYDFENDEMM